VAEARAAATSGQARRAVYLHVGGHKTGTTFVQNVLWHNRAALRRDGVLFPGERKAAHVWASHDLRGAAPLAQRAADVNGAWSRLVAEIAVWDGPAIVDQELFSLARPGDIARAFDDLSFAEVHVVFTARDMARQLPAVWQERVKNGDTQTYADFLGEIRARTVDSERFWGLHDVPGILAKWGAPLPPARVHVVTVPPPGAAPELLWQRFASTVGLDPARYRLGVAGTNRSLGAAAAAALRLVNLALADARLPKDAYDRLVKFGLAPRLAAHDGVRIGLPAAAFDWAAEVSRETVGALAAAGYDVVGSLDDLVPARRPDGADPDTLPAEETAGAALFALAAVLREQARTVSRQDT
jgi:hypothetical protein